MASPHTVQVLETTRATPAFDSPISTIEFSLPLTFFDTLFLKFGSIERIFFYQLNGSNPEYFNSVILPKLKRSLSLTLLQYFPLASNLRWPSNSPNPSLHTLLVMEFCSKLLSNEIHKALELHFLEPQLMMTDNIATIIALQITLFPSQGFCVGITTHHAILDGKSITMFVKSWVYLCKKGNTKNSSLPPELTLFYDRNVIKNPSGLDLVYLNQWLAFTSSDSDPNRRSLIILQNIKDGPNDLLRPTFDLTHEHIKSLREKVLSKLDKAKPLHYQVLFVHLPMYPLV
ncbi:hypothetical protein QQP08_013470 [Theobroma cacao]|nr:hypothetical protein QQP08_013470 [Theobroma cacao]